MDHTVHCIFPVSMDSYFLWFYTEVKVLPISWARRRIGVLASFLGITMHVASGGAASLPPSLRWILKRLIASPEDIPLHTILPRAKEEEDGTPNETNSTLPRWSFQLFCPGYALSSELLPTDLKFSSCPNDVDPNFFLQRNNAITGLSVATIIFSILLNWSVEARLIPLPFPTNGTVE